MEVIIQPLVLTNQENIESTRKNQVPLKEMMVEFYLRLYELQILAFE